MAIRISPSLSCAKLRRRRAPSLRVPRREVEGETGAVSNELRPALVMQWLPLDEAGRETRCCGLVAQPEP